MFKKLRRTLVILLVFILIYPACSLISGLIVVKDKSIEAVNLLVWTLRDLWSK